MKWHLFAGGTSAAEGKNSHLGITDWGNYYVDPITWPNGRHRGYVVRFANVKGLVPGGLWKDLSPHPVNLRTAKVICTEHHFGLIDAAKAA